MTIAKYVGLGGLVSAVFFGWITASNYGDIQYGVAEASPGNWIATAFTGITSVLSLVVSAVAQWKQTGTIPSGDIAEAGAIATLAAVYSRNGDEVGLRLVSELAKNANARKPVDAAVKKAEDVAEAVLRKVLPLVNANK